VTRESRVFIIEDRNEFLGVLVDRVGEVVEVESGRQEPLPANIPASRARFFLDVWRAAGQVITTLKAPEVLNEAN
jgi:purine-binding chemotaxis protein CheW